MKNSKPSEKAGYIKYGIFVFAVVFNICLVSFPHLISDKFQDRVLISFTMFSVVGLVFALEGLRLSLNENQNDLMTLIKEENRNVFDFMMIEKIFRSLRSVKETDDEVFYNHAKWLLESLDKKLEQAAAGEIILDPTELISIPLQLATGIQNNLKATVLWAQDAPKGAVDPLRGTARARYLEVLDEAIKERKVSVKRLFIIKSEDDKKSPEFKRRVKQDLSSKVEVRWILEQEWSHAEHVGVQAIDFGVWDDERVWLYRSDKDASLYRGKQMVQRYQKLFAANWERATVPIEDGPNARLTTVVPNSSGNAAP